MKGINTLTGKELGGIAHLKQSIKDILTTPIGTRIMRRDYGSRLFDLIDNPISEDLKTEIFAAVAESLIKWEPRFQLQQTGVVEITPGKIILELKGIFLISGSEIIISDLEIIK
jgi:phage baseplate assembly protein W